MGLFIYGGFDLALAHKLNKQKSKIVCNDFQLSGEERMLVITGPNQGGKTTFLRAIGLSQLMMQTGMFVPAESYSGNLFTGLFTHFKREEDSSMESGKFDEELNRMDQIIRVITPNAMILFNESFASTNQREGSEIAKQIVKGLVERSITVYFVTHVRICEWFLF